MSTPGKTVTVHAENWDPCRSETYTTVLVCPDIEEVPRGEGFGLNGVEFVLLVLWVFFWGAVSGHLLTGLLR